MTRRPKCASAGACARVRTTTRGHGHFTRCCCTALTTLTLAVRASLALDPPRARGGWSAFRPSDPESRLVRLRRFPGFADPRFPPIREIRSPNREPRSKTRALTKRCRCCGTPHIGPRTPPLSRGPVLSPLVIILTMQTATSSARLAAFRPATAPLRRASSIRRSPVRASRRAIVAPRAVFAAVVEPATKVSFPDTYDTHCKTKEMKCLGAGVREKKIAIIKVKVYAVAMYAEAGTCKAALASGKTLLDGEFHKALLVQLVRNVDGKTFWEALDDALVGRIKEIATNMATAEDEDGNFMATVAEAAEVAEEAAFDAMAELKDLFSGANLKKDSRVLIDWRPTGPSKTSVTGFDGVLTVGVVGTDVVVETKSMELARALFDVYLGDAPVAPDRRKPSRKARGNSDRTDDVSPRATLRRHARGLSARRATVYNNGRDRD